MCSGMVHFKVNLIFLIKICAVEKNRREANFSAFLRIKIFELFPLCACSRDEKMRRLWLDGIFQKEVPLSCETVERKASQKNVLSEDSIKPQPYGIIQARLSG